MVRGGGGGSWGYSPSRSRRGSSSRGSSWNGNSRGNFSSSSRYNSFSPFDSRSSFESRPKYSSDRFPRSDEYQKNTHHRSEFGGGSRERRSPERKRLRLEASSSRHESYYGSSRHNPPSFSDRRLSSERQQASPFSSRREEFRRPLPPPKRGSYRGRISSRGSRVLRAEERPFRRRLVERSYAVRRRIPRFSESRRLKISRMRSSIIARRRNLRNEEEIDVDEPEEDEKETEKPEESTETKEGETEKKSRKSFIKLHCPQCDLEVVTFRKYEIHLRGRRHMLAMKKVAMKQRAILNQMRKAQRNSQNELEKTSEDLGTRTNFCPICKLNYKQKKIVHQQSETHNNMKKFLMPFCKVCNITFKSPLVYEKHCCSIEHIKRKQRMESSDASAEEDNLENFTTIDSIGGDVEGEASEAEEKKEDEKDSAEVGMEKIRQIEAYYCDICKMYLQRGDESEIPKILTRHCKQRVHMHRYLRLKKAEDLERRKQLKRKEIAEKAALEGDKKDADGKWDEVDKEILTKAEASDEDEDSHVNGERYDRFKLSDKNGEEKLMGDNEEGILDNESKVEDK